jgi:hypothetical protein
MRWSILKTLMHKELLRHTANRSGLVLAGLLIAASFLIAVLNPAGEKSSTIFGGLNACFVHYEVDSPWIEHLKKNVPVELLPHVRFLSMETKVGPNQKVVYPPGSGAIQIRELTSTTQAPSSLVWIWYPPGNRTGMIWYEQWFWRETLRYFESIAKHEPLTNSTADPEPSWLIRSMLAEARGRWERLASIDPEAAQSLKTIPNLQIKESILTGGTLDMQAAINTALIIFALFFTCVYLMPSMTCEERERGLLLAQALSPATAFEILAAKFFFYPCFGVIMAVIMAGVNNPEVLTRLIFWVAMVMLAVGSLGIGMSIACLTKTQRSASLGALCYMLVVALVMLLCQRFQVTFLENFLLEYHTPQILHGLLTNQPEAQLWSHLGIASCLSVGWAIIAVLLFRRYGWQ